MDDPNAYARKSEQIIRINQPITVATRDNIYKQMGSQRTKANIYKTGYRKAKATLQEQQRINAAITSTLAAQASNAPTQTAITPQRVYQTRTVQTPMVQQTMAQTQIVQKATQPSATPVQVAQLPATPRPSVPTTVPPSQGNVRYNKLLPGLAKGTYNLRPMSLNNSTVTNTPITSTATPIGVGRSKTGAQVTQIKQEPPTPGVTTTPKTTTSTTTVVRKGKGRGKKASTVSVLDTVQDKDSYYVEIGGEEFNDSDSDATELYGILANITGPEKEAELDIEPEIEPPI